MQPFAKKVKSFFKKNKKNKKIISINTKREDYFSESITFAEKANVCFFLRLEYNRQRTIPKGIK